MSLSRRRSGYWKNGKWNYYKSKGQRKAAAAQTDNAKIVIKSNTIHSAGYDKTNRYGVAAINVWDVLAKNPQFINQKQNYDQVKINSVSARLTVADALISTASVTAVKSYQIILAWDRTGISESQLYLDRDAETQKVESFKTLIGPGIAGYSSAKKSQLNSFQRWNAYMSCYANSIMEKGQYVSTDAVIPFTGNENASTFTTALSNQDWTVEYWYNSANPATLFEVNGVPFKPTLLIGVFASGITRDGAGSGNVEKYDTTPPVLFNIEWSFDITYRGVRGSI